MVRYKRRGFAVTLDSSGFMFAPVVLGRSAAPLVTGREVEEGSSGLVPAIVCSACRMGFTSGLSQERHFE
jgi:hypothetical protein